MTTNLPFVPKDTTGAHRFTEEGYRGYKGPRRNLILWQCPHIGNDRYIEMYVNPQSISTHNKKTITSKRTKGGFINQYWGEELEVVNLQGITGDGGIEALNALEDVYRSEQLAMTEIIQRAFAGSEQNLIKRRQPIGPLSTSIVMWYMGQGKRGYFHDFQVEESVQQNGSFTYRMTFIVVETTGRRLNFMPWHRKPWSTTENPNVSSNGRLLVTGGYPGDNDTRLGRLNSPSGREAPVNVTDSATGDSVTRFTWVQNRMFDPKYYVDKGFINPLLFPTLLDVQADRVTTGIEPATTGEANTRISVNRASTDRSGLDASAEAGGRTGDTTTGTTVGGVPTGRTAGERPDPAAPTAIPDAPEDVRTEQQRQDDARRARGLIERDGQWYTPENYSRLQELRTQRLERTAEDTTLTATTRQRAARQLMRERQEQVDASVAARNRASAELAAAAEAESSLDTSATCWKGDWEDEAWARRDPDVYSGWIITAAQNPSQRVSQAARDYRIANSNLETASKGLEEAARLVAQTR